MITWPPADSLQFPGVMRLLYPFTAPVPVTTEVELLPLVSLGPRFDDLVFTLRNHDAANQVALYLDRSESGVAKNLAREILLVPPLKEGQLVFSNVLANYWSISAAGDPENGNPSCDVSWMIHARPRSL